MASLRRRIARPLAVLAAFFALSALLSVGCAASRDSALGKDESDLVEGKQKGDLARALQKADGHWQKRKDRAELQKAIGAYRKAVKMKSPELSEAERKERLAEGYRRLSRSYYFMADAHVRLGELPEKEREAKMIALYEKGITAAENAIVLTDSNLASAISGGDKLRKIVGQAQPAAIPGLYWYATNLGKWGLLKGIATILKHKENIRATMDFICETDAEYYYGGCHRYFGAYWLKIPFGKDPKKSKKHFDASIEIAPNYLATKVLKAKYYAEHTQDAELYKKLLNEVIEADTPEDAGFAPENYYEKQKAKRLLKQTEEKFY